MRSSETRMPEHRNRSIANGPKNGKPNTPTIAERNAIDAINLVSTCNGNLSDSDRLIFLKIAESTKRPHSLDLNRVVAEAYLGLEQRPSVAMVRRWSRQPAVQRSRASAQQMLQNHAYTLLMAGEHDLERVRR